MKRILNILIISTIVLVLTGCGSSKTTEKKEQNKIICKDYICNYADVDVLDQYETKKISTITNDIKKCYGCSNYSKTELDKLDKDISYKEIKFPNEGVYYVIYNNSDTSYDITYADDYTLNIAPHSARVATYYCWEELDCNIDTIAISISDNDNIADYELIKYEKNAENTNLDLYFKTNSSSDSALELHCVKDNKLSADFTGGTIKLESDTKEAMTSVHIDELDCDSFVYFINGTYVD